MNRLSKECVRVANEMAQQGFDRQMAKGMYEIKCSDRDHEAIENQHKLHEIITGQKVVLKGYNNQMEKNMNNTKHTPTPYAPGIYDVVFWDPKFGPSSEQNKRLCEANAAYDAGVTAHKAIAFNADNDEVAIEFAKQQLAYDLTVRRNKKVLEIWCKNPIRMAALAKAGAA